jgi:hypothetical protein
LANDGVLMVLPITNMNLKVLYTISITVFYVYTYKPLPA